MKTNKMQKTTLRQNVKATDRQWFVIDAEGQNLGQLAVVVANKIRGKHRVDFTPHVDGGDYVIILNAEKVAVTGRKEEQKKYYKHSGYLGHFTIKKLSEVREKNPERICLDAVAGMLPKNKLRKDQLRRLFIIVGDKNPYEAQKPEILKI